MGGVDEEGRRVHVRNTERYLVEFYHFKFTHVHDFRASHYQGDGGY